LPAEENLEPPPGASLRERIGVRRGTELLVAPTWEERVRGIERLATDGSDEAVEALVDAMADGSPVFANLKTRLAGVRALAPHADDSEVRAALVRSLSGNASGSGRNDDGGPDDPLDALVRATAAMALARADTREGATALLSKMLEGGASGEAARAALLAHPPASLVPLVRGFKKRISAPTVELLGDLGDPRAIGVLRRVLKTSKGAVREAAVVSLAELGDSTAAATARAWLGAAKPTRSQRLAATEALVALDAPDAPRAIAALLTRAATRSLAFELAERSLSPALVPTLAAVVKAPLGQSERLRATAILGRIGNPEAARVLLGLLAVPELATAAAFGLAWSRSDLARLGLARALAAAAPGAAHRLVLRAALVRYLALDERVAGLSAALEAALASDDAADRAVGAFGLAITRARSLRSLLADGRPELVHAAARAALALDAAALAALTDKLQASLGASDDVTAVAMGLALLLDAQAVPTSALAARAEAGGPLAPLAAMRLAARDSQLYRGRLVRLLEGTDPLVRLHVALGLAASPEKDAVSLLVAAYRFEPDADVRRAILRALSQRSEGRRQPTLEVARDLDPDAAVRGLARSALAGRRLEPRPPPEGRQVMWIALRANSEAEKGSVASRLAVLVRADGLALPVVTDPDGALLVPGLDGSGRVSLRLATLAPGGATRQPPRHGGARAR
jgi:hypothetical protein